MQIIEIWLNCPNSETATSIGDTLLQERLIASYNCYPQITSGYHWKGQIEHAREVPLLLKTRIMLFERVDARIMDLHPYETPSILARTVEFANARCLAWVYAETVDP